jgi:uncharacterized protein YjcR
MKKARPHQIARDLWLERVPVPTIAAEIGVNKAKIWRWRYLYGWPARVPLGVERATLVTMAAKCWHDGLPRIDIALLCNISLGTLDAWRQRYHWEKRRPGLRPGAGQGLRAREQQRVQQLRERTELRKHRVVTVVTKLRNERRWRCCDMLLDTPTCPTCQRRWPLCA